MTTDESDNAGDSTSTLSSSQATYPAWHNAIAGGAAGAGARMITAPLDLIRIRRQLTPPMQYPHESVLQSWRNIVQTEGGVAALFRGNVPAVYLWVGYAAVQFSLYNRTKEFLHEKDPDKLYPTTIAFLAGATAGLFATVATYPFDVCRTTFAARGLELAPATASATASATLALAPIPQRTNVPFSSLVEPHYNTHLNPPPPPPTATQAVTTTAHSPSAASPLAASTRAPPRTLTDFVAQLYKKKGVRGFYAGCGPAIIQIIPYMGINFAIYDWLTAGDRRVGLSACAGSLSGAISKIVIYPVDTVKRRLQAQAFYDSSHRYDGMLDCVRTIARKEGLHSFYRGVVPSVLKTTISTGLSFAFFRSAKNALEVLYDGGAIHRAEELRKC